MSTNIEQYMDYVLDSGCSPDDCEDDEIVGVVSSKIKFIQGYSDWMCAEFCDDEDYPVTDEYNLAEVIELSNGEVIAEPCRSPRIQGLLPYGWFKKLGKG